jgi:hypothetical protein
MSGTVPRAGHPCFRCTSLEVPVRQNLKLIALPWDQSASINFPASVILLHAFKLNLLNFCQALPLPGNEMIQLFMQMPDF